MSCTYVDVINTIGLWVCGFIGLVTFCICGIYSAINQDKKD